MNNQQQKIYLENNYNLKQIKVTEFPYPGEYLVFAVSVRISLL